MKLVLMGDLHYHDMDEAFPEWVEARNTFFETMVDRFLELDGDIHISLGDLTNYGSATELAGVYELLRKKDRTFYHALGNHDLYAQTRKDVLGFTGQPRYHAVETDRAVLVFLDTAKEQDFEDWGGWVDEEQLQWFEGVVRASETKLMLVFAHHPVHNTTKRSEREKGSIHPSIDMWSVLRQKEGVGIYFNGHTHVDSIVQQHQWTFVQLSACLDQHALRVVEVGTEQVQISAVDVMESGVLDTAPTLYKHMKHFTPNPDARGEAADRECVVSLMTAGSALRK
jgi:Icc protein